MEGVPLSVGHLWRWGDKVRQRERVQTPDAVRASRSNHVTPQPTSRLSGQRLATDTFNASSSKTPRTVVNVVPARECTGEKNVWIHAHSPLK